MEKGGHQVIITARDFAQTKGLLKRSKIPSEFIGSHGGKNRVKKTINELKRSAKLTNYVRKKKIDLAVSFNSSSQAVATRILGIPSVIFMDYEYQPLNHLTFRLAQKVIVPKLFPVVVCLVSPNRTLVMLILEMPALPALKAIVMTLYRDQQIVQ